MAKPDLQLVPRARPRTLTTFEINEARLHQQKREAYANGVADGRKLEWRAARTWWLASGLALGFCIGGAARHLLGLLA